MKQEALVVENLGISSEDETILRDVNISLFKGELLSIYGSFESGNTELAKAVAGIAEFNEGSISADGKRIEQYTYEKAQRSGTYYLDDNPMLISNMTVADNIFAIRKVKGFRLLYKRTLALSQAKILFDMFGFDIDLGKYAYELTEIEAFLVQIVKVLLLGAKVVILNLTSTNIYREGHLRLLDFIRRQKKISFIYVSNRLDEIIQESDRIVTMQKGKVIKIMYHDEYSVSDLNKCAHGREFISSPKRALVQTGKTVFQLKDFAAGKRILNLTVAQREIVGILDLDGSGRDIINKLSRENLSGIIIDGKKVLSYRKAVNSGMTIVKNRFDFNDYFECFDIKKNITFEILKRISKFGIINSRLEKYVLKKTEMNFDRSESDESRNSMYTKALLQRKLLTNPKIIIVDNIAVSFDVKVSEELYTVLNKEVEKGRGILAIFSGADDCINFSDRIYVPSKRNNTFEMYTKENFNLI